MRKLLRARLDCPRHMHPRRHRAGAVYSRRCLGQGYGRARSTGSNCYIQSGGEHTFYFNEGASTGSPYLACRLFNSINANK